MAENKAKDLPANQALAQARHVNMTAMKVRRIVNEIRGLPVDAALTYLRFAPQAAAEPVYKVVASAAANARNNSNKQLQGDLVIAEAYVDEGPTLKRFRPRAQGRAYRIRKRSSHITIVVEEKTAVAAGKKGRTR